MKRPLLFMAIVLALGIYILCETGLFESLFQDSKVPFRIWMEEEDLDQAFRRIRGTVFFTFPKGDKYGIILKAGDEYGELQCETTENPPLPGDIISCSGMVSLYPQGTNPGVFDTREYYDNLGYYLKYKIESYEVLGNKKYLFLNRALSVFRIKGERQIEKWAEEEDRGFFKNIFAGDTSAFKEEMKDDFQDLGIFYLLSATGFQMTLIGMGIFRFFRKTTGKVFLSGLVSVIIIFLDVILTGFSVSAVRALIVLTVRVLALFFKRKFDALDGMALSLILLLLNRPKIIYISSIQYVLAVTFGIHILYNEIRVYLFHYDFRWNRILFILSLQTVLLPLTIHNSYSCSLYSGILVLLLSPLKGVLFLTVFLGIMGSFISGTAGVFFFGTGHYIRKLYMMISKVFLKLPGAQIITGNAEAGKILIYFLLIIGLLVFLRIQINRRKETDERAEKTIRKKDYYFLTGILFSIFIFGIFFLRISDLEKNESEIIFLDVGQGDSIFFRFSDGKTMLIDSGSSTKKEIYDYVLEPALRYYGCEIPDVVAMTHGDSDHISGILEMVEKNENETFHILLPENQNTETEFQKLYDMKEKRKMEIRTIHSGDSFEIDGNYFNCLSPEKDSADTGNEMSMVLLYRFQKFSGLFTGDMGIETEEKIRNWPAVDLLKVGHHGSKTSSGEEFLKKVSPRASVLSYGKNNSYGHPSPETIRNLLKTSSGIYETGKSGAIRIHVGNNGFQVSTFLENKGDF